MAEVSYVHYFDLENRIRVNALSERNEITQFTVQLEFFFENRWIPMVRYDTAHLFFHRDLYRADGKVEKTPLYFENLNLAFTYAVTEIKKNWKKFAENYILEKRRRKR